MKSLIYIIIAILWLFSYMFVVKKFDDYMWEKNYPVNLENIATPLGKALLFFVAPVFAAWFAWIDLKMVLILLYVKVLDKYYSVKKKHE